MVIIESLYDGETHIYLLNEHWYTMWQAFTFW